MSEREPAAWRIAALGGFSAGLALAAPAGDRGAPATVLLLAIATVALRSRIGTLPWVALVALVGALAGLAVGGARLAAIDARVLLPPDGDRIRASGTIVTAPRDGSDATRFVVEVDGKRIGVELLRRAPGLEVGRRVSIAGVVGEPQPWEAASLARNGAARVITASRLRALDGRRAGVSGALDRVRMRAEAALQRGTPEASAALLRGFVLGQDDRILASVREDFRRSGLAHILAVSGQNVMLLILLATPLLALAGVPFRARLACLAAIVAIYVPVAGAGPSIQRAGVMGVAGLVAALASRPTARWYALLLAAAVTLAVNPRATGDVGWQLSFAAVAGLLVLAGPLAQLLKGSDPASARRLLAEGAAMTVAATLATGPLVAHHFGVVSLTAVPANLVALPAIAPAMWLGMLSGALGQVPGAPVEPLTALGGLCAAFIGWTANTLGGARAELPLAEPSLLLAITVAGALILSGRLACRAIARRATLRPPRAGPRPRFRAVLAVVGGAVVIALASGLPDRGSQSVPRPRLMLRVLDVGQGDSILLEPRGVAPVLIDTGPPGGGAARRLTDLGIERLAALVITHDDLDHAGAIQEVLAAVEVGRVVVGPGVTPRGCRVGRCPPSRPVVAGDSLRLGPLRLDVLWPQPASRGPDEERNAASLVLLASSGRFRALLTGDAEAELAPVSPGPIDVLKVAHHGSADEGLEGLLARTHPDLALISVGPNRYGHPSAQTIDDLGAAGVEVRRTDTQGELAVAVRAGE